MSSILGWLSTSSASLIAAYKLKQCQMSPSRRENAYIDDQSQLSILDKGLRRVSASEEMFNWIQKFQRPFLDLRKITFASFSSSCSFYRELEELSGTGRYILEVEIRYTRVDMIFRACWSFYNLISSNEVKNAVNGRHESEYPKLNDNELHSNAVQLKLVGVCHLEIKVWDLPSEVLLHGCSF